MKCYQVIAVLASSRGRGLASLSLYSAHLRVSARFFQARFSLCDQRLRGRRREVAKFRGEPWASRTGTLHSFIYFLCLGCKSKELPLCVQIETSCPFPVLRKVMRN